MKKYVSVAIIQFLLAITLMHCSSCSFFNNSDCTENIYKVSPEICNTLFSCTPKEFCDSNGANTLLENNFLSAVSDKNGNLILELSDVQKECWIANSFHMQVFYAILNNNYEKTQHPFISGLTPSLQKMLEDQIEYAKTDTFKEIFIKGATTCNYDISETYSKITVHYDDDVTNVIMVVPACIHMQIINGVDSNDIRVETVYLNENGSVKSTDVWVASVFK